MHSISPKKSRKEIQATENVCRKRQSPFLPGGRAGLKGGRLPGQNAAGRKSRPRGGEGSGGQGIQNSSPAVVREKNWSLLWCLASFLFRPLRDSRGPKQRRDAKGLAATPEPFFREGGGLERWYSMPQGRRSPFPCKSGQTRKKRHGGGGTAELAPINRRTIGMNPREEPMHLGGKWKAPAL